MLLQNSDGVTPNINLKNTDIIGSPTLPSMTVINILGRWGMLRVGSTEFIA